MSPAYKVKRKLCVIAFVIAPYSKKFVAKQMVKMVNPVAVSENKDNKIFRKIIRPIKVTNNAQMKMPNWYGFENPSSGKSNKWAAVWPSRKPGNKSIACPLLYLKTKLPFGCLNA